MSECHSCCQLYYQAHNVDEDIPVGSSILKVKSTDADSGSNAEIEYYVSDDHFTVNSKGVVSNNKRLDADSNNAYYEFIVTAKDKGEPPRTGTATVRIYTENKNDEEPKFSQQVCIYLIYQSILSYFLAEFHGIHPI